MTPSPPQPATAQAAQSQTTCDRLLGIRARLALDCLARSAVNEGNWLSPESPSTSALTEWQRLFVVGDDQVNAGWPRGMRSIPLAPMTCGFKPDFGLLAGPTWPG